MNPKQKLSHKEKRNIETLIEMAKPCNDIYVDRYALISAAVYVRRLWFQNYDTEQYDLQIAQLQKMLYVQEMSER